MASCRNETRPRQRAPDQARGVPLTGSEPTTWASIVASSTVAPSSERTASPTEASARSTRSCDETTASGRTSGSSLRRTIAKLTPGGMDAEIVISEMRYGEPFVRSEVLVISWSAVALMINSASVPGSIRSMTVVTPRLAIPTASRAPLPALARPWLSRSVVPGSPAVRPAAAATSRACPAAASAASRARWMKLTPFPTCHAAGPGTAGHEH